jgi:uncharacterized Ntn-hydrolase superfamily protein
MLQRPHRYDHDLPLAGTYSILARDPLTGEMGAAVQSHWFSVGSVVIWGEAGLGVVATQSFVNPSYGKRGLGSIRKGMLPEEIISKLISGDDGRESRQLAILDREGRGAAYTGCGCIPSAGHIVGEDHTVQANLMCNDKIWPAMSDAFIRSKGHLAVRMLAALDAAEIAGGDIRGRQSAAMLIVKGRSSRRPWEDRTLDLRVDDHPEPLQELRRLLDLHRAYERMNQGDLAMEKGRMEEAQGHYQAAEGLFPSNEEMMFWHAVALANNGYGTDARPLLMNVFLRNSAYIELARRLIEMGMLKVGALDLDGLVDQIPQVKDENDYGP